MAEQGRHFYIEWLSILTNYNKIYWQKKSDEELEKEYFRLFEGRNQDGEITKG